MIDIDDELFGLDSLNKIGLTTTARNELWPALLEKAILKLYNSATLQLSTNPSFEIFHLSGWIPEIIKFSEISDKSQLFIKIKQNFEDGNVLLCLGMDDNAFFPIIDFSIKDNSSMIKVILASPNLMVKYTEAYSKLISMTSASHLENDTGVKWLHWTGVVLEKFDALYLSWNPSIYSFRFTFNSVWYKGERQSLFWDEDHCLENNPQFLIHLPPHSSNLEVVSAHQMRVFLEKFTEDFTDPSANCIGYKLFTFGGHRAFHSSGFLRSCTTNKREIFSDVFIFERSDKSEFFNLVVLKSGLTKENWEKYPSEVSFTIGVD